MGKLQYIPALDGLRGVAACGVVLFHLSPTTFFWMWSFVDLFFVISGFVVSGIILNSLDDKGLSLRNFWLRRVLRIWPVYYLTLFFVVCCVLLQQGSDQFLQDQSGHARLASVFLQFTPYYFLENTGPWQPYYFLPGFFHSWSLAIEEQFYVVWPLFLMFFSKWKSCNSKRALIAIAVVLLCVMAFSVHARSNLQWHPYMLLSRLDGLVLGSIFALLYCRGNLSTQVFRHCAPMLLVIGGIGATPYMVNGLSVGGSAHDFLAYPGVITSFSVLYLGLIMAVIFNPESALSRLLASKHFVYLGAISYAVYMFHVPLLKFLLPVLDDHVGKLGAQFLILIALFISAEASRRYLETPVLKLKARFQ